ncbi:hypothetical protein BGZ47_002979 [Haplosporangium gracile]|nr:hypothetical protein BGZ47_002979 [Haplosporangium gracile]
MEATATSYSNGTTAESAPSPEDANGISKQPRDNNNNKPTPTVGTGTASSPETQSHFESRGNLDTLVAAALKPLAAADDYPQRHHSSPQRYGHISNNTSTNNSSIDNINNESLKIENQHSFSTPHSRHHRESPSHSPHHADSSLSSVTGGSDLNPSHLQTTSSPSEAVEATATTAHSHHEHSSSKYHYREQGRAISDEDSEEDPSPASRQHSHHTHPAAAPSEYPSGHPHTLQEEPDSAFKSNARSSMSISSLLGDSSGYARRTAGDDKDLSPDHHATTRHLTPSPVVRPSGAQSEGLFEQRCTERVAKHRAMPEMNLRAKMTWIRITCLASRIRTVTNTAACTLTRTYTRAQFTTIIIIGSQKIR